MHIVVFPGQGSQFVGMGKELFSKFPTETSQASEALGYDIQILCTRDPDKKLNLTQYTQPALYVAGALSWLDKKQDMSQIDYLMGHSLGEYNALYAAGAFDFMTGLRLVQERGRLMASTSGGGMLVVLGLEAGKLQDFLKTNNLSQVEIANYNTAMQLVLSGNKQQIGKTQTLLEKRNIQAIPLNVSAAFHSSYMKKAATEFKIFLRKFKFSPLKIKVIANTTARPYQSEEIADNLEKQIASSVLWDESIRYLMVQDKQFTFTELSEKRILTHIIDDIKSHEQPLKLTEELASNKHVLEAVVGEKNANKRASNENKKQKMKQQDKSETQKQLSIKNETQPTKAATTDKTMQIKNTSKQITIIPERLGASSFCQRYGIKYSYLTGAMYRGIASKELVVAMGKTELLGFFGTAGLSLKQIESAIQYIQQQLEAKQAYGMNLICDLDNPQMEMDSVELYLKFGVTCMEASAFLGMTKALVYYRLCGLSRQEDGSVACKNRILAKVSRPEVAQAFLSPPPRHMVEALLDEGKITPDQARMAESIAMSFYLCVEADSGGHTDQGVATVLFPTMQRLKQRMQQQHQYGQVIHVGLAGGIGTPEAAAAAFIMGADFVLTGSINQCTVEGGTSDAVKNMLQEMNVQDTDYAPAGDMFELGAKVQVLKKGVFFPARANKLFSLYKHYDDWKEVPESIQSQLERRYFQKTFTQVWQEVESYHQNLGQQATLDKAYVNGKHKMALVFRWYFFYSTKLAFDGDDENRIDFQVHTGPALGAFNQWVKGSNLESWRNRHVDQIAEKLMKETADLLTHKMNFLA